MKYWLVLTVLMPLLAFANSIDRVEPPSWWVGMDSAKLQLLAHGKNIGQLQPKLDHPGVSVINVHKADSPNYLFIDLRIDPDAAVGEMALEFYRGETLTARWPYSLQARSEEHTSELQSRPHLVCRLLLEKKN